MGKRKYADELTTEQRAEIQADWQADFGANEVMAYQRRYKVKLAAIIAAIRDLG